MKGMNKTPFLTEADEIAILADHKAKMLLYHICAKHKRSVQTVKKVIERGRPRTPEERAKYEHYIPTPREIKERAQVEFIKHLESLIDLGKIGNKRKITKLERCFSMKGGKK